MMKALLEALSESKKESWNKEEIKKFFLKIDALSKDMAEDFFHEGRLGCKDFYTFYEEYTKKK